MMLADAIRAETWRLLQNRTAMFWSVAFVPLISLALATASFLFIRSKMDGAMQTLPVELKLTASAVDLGQSLVDAAGGLANPGVLAFLLIGAATVFAGDYRLLQRSLNGTVLGRLRSRRRRLRQNPGCGQGQNHPQKGRELIFCHDGRPRTDVPQRPVSPISASRRITELHLFHPRGGSVAKPDFITAP